MEKQEFKEIKLEDKTLFDKYFEKYPGEISEFSFVNLFSWRKFRKHKFCEFENHLVIASFSGDLKIYEPVGENSAEIMQKLAKMFPEAHFERVSEKTAQVMKEKEYSIYEQRDTDDYVYSTEDMRELKGRKYEHKRTFINQYEKNNPRTELLSENNIGKCMELQKKWFSEKGENEKNEILHAENEAILETLENFRGLDLIGACIFIGEEIQGFAIGEKLNNSTVVEHTEKADTKYKGAYQYLLREFAKSVPDKYIYINREQDLGILGLRKAKMGCLPVKMIKQFRIEYKKN